MKVRSRKPYPTDVTDEEWAFVGPYLALLPEDAGQRRYAVREVFNALRWIVRAGAPWRLLPHELPPWPVVYQQTQRWIAAVSGSDTTVSGSVNGREGRRGPNSPRSDVSLLSGTTHGCLRWPRRAVVPLRRPCPRTCRR